eukprot:Skav209532  [mRNA]  locus=scaffold2497:18111:18920:- [translate_table: standard]
MNVIQIRTGWNGKLVDSLTMQWKEMRLRPEMALDVIRRRAEQALVGKVTVRRIVYQDDEGDSCTLTVPSLSDALDLCKDGVLRLKLVTEPATMTELKAEDLMDELLKRVEGLNLHRVWERLGEAGLELLAELQPQWQDEWAKLIQPLNLLASGCQVDQRELCQLALGMYERMEGPLQHKVKELTLQSLETVVQDVGDGGLLSWCHGRNILKRRCSKVAQNEYCTWVSLKIGDLLVSVSTICTHKPSIFPKDMRTHHMSWKAVTSHRPRN